MNKKEISKEVILVISSFLAGGILMFLLLRWLPIQEKRIINNTHIYEKSSLAPAVEKIYDAVVFIQKEGGNGTGFIYKVDDKYGYILTNQHVLPEEKTIELITSNKETIEGEVLGSDEYLDLAVIRISKKPVSLVATIGNSETMSLGDTVFAIGSPINENYQGSVTAGILSGKDRMVPISVESENNIDWIMKVLQVDASINPGNSGGPLLNANGEVIGVVSLKLVDDKIEGMGFAIPIEYAMNHVKSLENGKTIKWPSLGIEMINVTDKTEVIKNQITIPSSIKEGVVITKVKDSSAASKAKLKEKDIITKINNEKIKDMAYLRYELYQHQAGDTITISINRSGKEKQIKVTLGG